MAIPQIPYDSNGIRGRESLSTGLHEKFIHSRKTRRNVYRLSNNGRGVGQKSPGGNMPIFIPRSPNNISFQGLFVSAPVSLNVRLSDAGWEEGWNHCFPAPLSFGSNAKKQKIMKVSYLTGDCLLRRLWNNYLSLRAEGLIVRIRLCPDCENDCNFFPFLPSDLYSTTFSYTKYTIVYFKH
ncbi:hypothetical protein AVEN_21249-1 [Araneus ventricosus]|uniref:Uncharacterized protein n=1 Tax=Araneus ventricosus TaxID=182803 RepID=A0A4Y2GHI6_ARAVE|nr:hypothetical protein AVEN_21249-1 [Araneus ventricosus]